MPYKKKKNSNSLNDNSDYVKAEFKRNEKKVLEKTSVTGSGSDEDDNRSFKLQRIQRIVTILTQFSLVLGFLIFLLLWLL